MANSHFSEKKWKYVSVGLMAVLAVGFSFPQAFAHVTSNMQHGMEHVIALLNAIKAKTDNLPSDPASQTAVENAMFTQVVRSDFSGGGETHTCTANKDFVVHITVLEAEPGADLSIEIGEGGVLGSEVEHMGTLTIGGKADETISITTEISDSLPDLQGFMTLQTVKGATASCD